jgi:hypothetical protein
MFLLGICCSSHRRRCNSGSRGEAVVRISALALCNPTHECQLKSPTDINGVSLQLTAGVSIAGRIHVDDMPLSNMPGWENVRVPLKPTVDSSFAPNLQPAQPVAQRPTADGSFTVDGVGPGEFIVGPVTGLAPGFYVKEARFSQADVLGQPLRFFAGGAGTLEIVLSSKAGNISGTAVDAAMRGAATQVVLVPERAQADGPLQDCGERCEWTFSVPQCASGDYACSAGKRSNPMRTSIRSYFACDSQGVPVHVSESAETPSL